MRSNIRASGIDAVGDLSWGTHFCQFYQTKEDLMDVLVPYFKAGLENNEFCMWIASQPLEVEDAKEVLRKVIPDFDVYLGKGQIEIIHYTDWYLKKGAFNSERILKDWIDRLNKALTSGYGGLRAIESTCWLEKESWNDFVDYEERLDSLINMEKMIVLCPYCLDTCSATDIIEITANHQFTLIKKEGKWAQIESSGQKNITKLKRAEETLHASEARYRSLYENSLDAILLTRPDGAILSANPQACRMFGMTEDEIIQAGREGLVVKDKKLAAALEERDLTGRTKAELTFRRKDGSTFVGEIFSNLFTDADGNIKTSMIIRDITERKQAEEALRKSEERFRMLFTNMTEGFLLAEIICDKDGKPYDYRFLEVNPAYELNTGIKREKVLGQSILEVLPKASRTAIEKFGEVALSGKSTHFEVFSQAADKYFEVYAFSPEKGKFAVIFKDITERKRVEEALRESRAKLEAAIESMTDAVFISDFEGNFVNFNDAFVKFHRFHSKKECYRKLFKYYLDIFEGYFLDGTPAPTDMWPVRRALRGEIATDAELIVRRKDTGETWIASYSFAPIRDKDGVIIGSVVVGRDITGRKQLEEQTRQRAEEIEAIMEVAPVAIWIGHDPQSHNITGNRMANEFYEAKEGENVSANVTPVRRFFYRGRELTADELPMQQASLKDIDVRNVEFDVLLPSGEWRGLLGSASPLHDADGRVRGSVGTFIDITERKKTERALRQAYEEIKMQSEELQASNEKLQTQAEELQEANKALLESEKQYSTLFNARTNGIAHCQVIVDKQGKPIDYIILQVNDAYEEITGIKKEDIEGRKATEVFPGIESFAYDYIGNYGKVALEGSELNIEVFFETLQQWLSIYVYSPKYTEFTAIFTDITKRKKAEEALHESEEKYRIIVETANEGIWTVDPEARTTYANEKIAEMLGYTQNEMIGRPAWDFTSGEDKVMAKQNMEKREQGIDERYEIKLIRKDGSPLWTFVSGKSLFDKNGSFRGSMAMVTDITERKEAEGKLKETLDNLDKLVKERTTELEKAYISLKESEKGLAEAQRMAHIGNWEQSLVTNKLYWSDETYRIFGFKPQEFEATYKLFLNYVHPDDRDYVDNTVKRTFNEKPSGIDYRILLDNGEERIVHGQGEVIFDENSTPIRIRGTIQDITERKKAEEALAKIEKIRIKEIHHRIKNNLQVISSLLDLQAETFSHLDVCKVPEVIEAFMESQNRIISMALIHEELYKGDGVDSLDFAAYLRKLISELFVSYNPGNNDVTSKLSLEQVYLGMDTAIPLGIIVNELVSNSFKHAFPAGERGEIQINLRKIEAFAGKNNASDSDEGCLHKGDFRYVLTIADNGRGIPDEIDLQNINSLGLQLANILVEQIDGCIELKRDHGTEYAIWFNDLEK